MSRGVIRTRGLGSTSTVEMALRALWPSVSRISRVATIMAGTLGIGRLVAKGALGLAKALSSAVKGLLPGSSSMVPLEKGRRAIGIGGATAMVDTERVAGSSKAITISPVS